ncbi:hypothetical protein ACFO0N_06570 [Halobium salinum]|uniref:DUF8159 domain-containing protein n=1 Tax=Halobium salinum TaxID=1364940 RepID=A0ABD5PA80_9EURY|nr:hypothetical protein [Halobium salinum]
MTPSPGSSAPTRRRVLGGLAAVASLGACAGCAQTAGEKPTTATPSKEQTPVQDERPSLPVVERWDRAARRVEVAADADVTEVDSLVAAVERGGPSVSGAKAKTEGKLLELTCEVDPGAEGGAVAAVAHVAGTYAALVEHGTPLVRLDGTIVDVGGDAYGSFQLHEAWANRYLDGEWSASDYGEASLGTLKTKG